MEPADDHTQLLIRKAREGDADAKNELFGRYQGRISRLVRVFLGGRLRRRVEANDLVQSVLLQAVRDFDQFEHHEPGDLLRWLLRIAENRVRDRLKHELRGKRDVRREQSVAEASTTALSAAPEATGSPPSQIAMRGELAAHVHAAIRDLPDDLRQVFLLRAEQNFPWRTIAERTGCGIPTVRYQFSRAIGLLRQSLKDVGG